MSLLDNLMAHWRLNEASGTREDAHGGNDLSDNNTVLSAAGKLGDAAAFVAANEEYLSIADNADLSVGDEDFTIAAWLYLDSKPDEMMAVTKYDAGDTKEYRLDYAGASQGQAFRFLVSSNGSDDNIQLASSFGDPSTGTWYFVVAWHDSVNDTLNIQVNDGTVDSSAYSLGCADRGNAFLLGADKDSVPRLFWDGRIDSVSFWKRVLTSGERSQLYNGGNGLDYPFGSSLRPKQPRIVQPPFPYFVVNQ